MPDIAQRAFSEASGLAYDGESFYVADWAGASIVKIHPDGRIEPLSMKDASGQTASMALLRPIRIAALGKERLLVETDDGKLRLWDRSRQEGPIFRELHHDFERKTGSPFCWDGLYIWLTNGDSAFPAMALGNGELVKMPRREKRPGLQIAGELDLSLSIACSREKFYLLVREADDWMIVSDAFVSQADKHLWMDQNSEPLAITSYQDDRLVVLAEVKGKGGAFKLLFWEKGGTLP